MLRNKNKSFLQIFLNNKTSNNHKECFEDFIQYCKEIIRSPRWTNQALAYVVKGTLQTSCPKSPINILLARQLWAHSSPKPREETKKHSINFKFQTTFNIFSLFTSYAITLLVKVTYVQVWLEPCRQASALEKVKQVPPKASKKWKSHKFKWNFQHCSVDNESIIGTQNRDN